MGDWLAGGAVGVEGVARCMVVDYAACSILLPTFLLRAATQPPASYLQGDALYATELALSLEKPTPPCTRIPLSHSFRCLSFLPLLFPG